MRIAIIGAGGVGAYFGGVLARAGHEVVMLARGEHLEALRARGIEVRNPEGSFVAPVAVTDNPDEIGRVDWAIVAVKSYSLAEVAATTRSLAESGALILPLLNGVEVVKRLTELGVPAGQILAGMTQISAVRVEPGVVERKSDLARITFGEVEGGISERATRFAETCQQAGIDVRVSEEIRVDLWRKFAFIASAAAACGLARISLGEINKTTLGHLLIERLIGEVIAVGRALGVALPPGEEEAQIKFIDGLAISLKPSLLVDLEAGRPTEINDLSGAVARLGRVVGIETPTHDTAAAALGVEH
ncbi:ketopantoate reductase family protein [Singulisphaera sp. PoT]|uniref:ketopantoate reductase family protein n=1 Tax=Singulisphaera sp. PoT TaxID=3411797 RepID=UPI003BF5B72E